MKNELMNKPRLSVIMPLYNKAPYIQKALESVVSQTYRDFEIIIVDDGSTDCSLSIIQGYARGLRNLDFRLHVLSQKNVGVAAARNRGVAESSGEFLCFLDADDWWEPEFLEEMDRLIAEYPDAGIYASNYIYYKPGKTHVALNLLRGYINYPKAYLHGEMPVWTGATCMPRKVFDEMGGFLEGIKLGEDFLLWAKTSLHYKVAFCENPLAYYNNDVPVHMRATRNLHAPQSNMLFNLSPLESEIQRNVGNDASVEDWKWLLDKLRVGGLMEYWLNEEYHNAAAAELKKVDWDRQSKKNLRMYKMPICVLKANRKIMQIGSYCKQKLIRLLNFK